MSYEKFVESNSLNYLILEMKFKQGKSYSEIATTLNKSSATIGQRYRMFSWSLYRCYFRYLKSIGMEEDVTDIRNFYESFPHVIAYLEKQYSEELTLYRGGKPPVFFENVKSLPPFRKLSDRQLLNLEKKIVKARESQGKTFVDIGKEYKITWQKARCMYNRYYHKKVMKALDRIEAHTGNDLSFYIFHYSYYSRKRWELIVGNFPDLVQDLIDN